MSELYLYDVMHSLVQRCRLTYTERYRICNDDITTFQGNTIICSYCTSST